MDATAQYALAYALTTTAGLRGFLTLLAASLAAHAGWIHPAGPFGWLGTNTATAVLAAFTVLEILADKIPVVDHALHTLHFVVRPVAGAILAGSTVHTDNQFERDAAMAIGALNAFVVHGAVSTTRAGSSAVSLGAANPFISIVEDIGAAAGILLAFWHPIVAAIVALAFVALVLYVMRRLAVGVRRAKHDSG